MRKPKIEYYWTQQYGNGIFVVNWRLVGANGEIICSSNQGFQDKRDAERSVSNVAMILSGWGTSDGFFRIVGPGRKPK